MSLSPDKKFNFTLKQKDEVGARKIYQNEIVIIFDLYAA
jgi:hypothetical protein